MHAAREWRHAALAVQVVKAAGGCQFVVLDWCHSETCLTQQLQCVCWAEVAAVRLLCPEQQMHESL